MDVERRLHSSGRCLDSGMMQNVMERLLPATEEGVAAAWALEAAGVRTNLTLVAGIRQAPPLFPCRDQLLLSHEGKRKAVYRDLDMHPGTEIIQATLQYFKLHEIRTQLVGSDFRELAELSALPGFDGTSTAPCKVSRKRDWVHGLMSAEAHGMLAASMYPALVKMELQMNSIEKIVTGEVARQLALKTLEKDPLVFVATIPVVAVPRQAGSGINVAKVLFLGVGVGPRDEIRSIKVGIPIAVALVNLRS
ncbi:hypothetical protein B0H19DRAFT_1080284 [Mycena capillaripes]|nr:hypothetical protein B0H19DRAFT_1080284 [Mycena capillaripes]